MKNKTLLLFSFLLSFILTYGQSYVKGTIFDSTRKAISSCTLQLLRKTDSAVVVTASSNEKGSFELGPVRKDIYLLKVSSIGYQDYYSGAFTLDSAQQRRVSIILNNKSTRLQEVTVEAQKPGVEFRNGMIVLNVENTPLAAGNTVLEVLRRVPGVIFDGRGGIMINGQTGVQFLIDGKLQQIPTTQLLSMFSTMSAASVSSIELMKSPSAKYDASGTAGLINIVMKKTKIKGFSGQASESVAYGQRTSTNPSLNLNLRSDRLSLYANIGYGFSNSLNSSSSERTQYMTSPPPEAIASTGSGDNRRSAFNFRASAEYNLTSKTLIGLTVSDGPTNGTSNNNSTTDILSSHVINYSLFTSRTHNHETFSSPSATFYIQQKLSPNGTLLEFSTTYTDFKLDQLSLNENYFLNNAQNAIDSILGYQNRTQLNFKIFNQKLDYTKKWGKTLTLETGVKSSFVRNSSNAALDTNYAGTENYYADLAYSSLYVYKERILAGYASMTKSFKKVSLQTGLRSEQTHVDAEDRTHGGTFTQDYINFFPNLALSYRQDQKNSYQLTYSYRIRRPNYDELNPIRLFENQLEYATGNTHLHPQYSHVINFDYNYKNFIVNSINFTHIDNNIYHYSFLDASNIQVDTVLNYSSRNNLYYTLFIQKQLAKWFNLQFNGVFAYTAFSGQLNGASFKNDSYVGYLTLNGDILLPNKFNIQVHGRYSTPYTDGIQHYSSRGSLDMAIQKRLNKDRLTLVLAVSDLFHTDYGRVSTTLPDQSSYAVTKTDSRRVRISLIYKFGNLRANRKPTTDDPNDETKRIEKIN